MGTNDLILGVIWITVCGLCWSGLRLLGRGLHCAFLVLHVFSQSQGLEFETAT